MQVAGIINKDEGNFTGFQTAGIVNILKGDLNGLQLSVGNISQNIIGAQIGVVNIGARISGVKIGVINIADDINGVPIGIINYSKKGNIHAVVWGSNIILTNVGVKFAVNDYFYSILCGGYNNRSKNVSKSLAVGYFMGLHFPLDERIYLDTDIGGYTVDNDKFFTSEEGIKNQNMLQARLLLGYKFSEGIAIFAGIGGNYTVESKQKFKDGKNETMFMVGLQLF
jgi:hypothetical protein